MVNRRNATGGESYTNSNTQCDNPTKATVVRAIANSAHQDGLTDVLAGGAGAVGAKSYSVVRALNALANPTDAAAQRAAAFERECSEAASSKLGKQARGLHGPRT